MGPVALLNASVLYPSLIRNLLMHQATAGLIGARWTDAIHDEWIRNLLEDRPDLSEDRLHWTRQQMEAVVHDATVQGYESLIPALVVPHPDDRHVLAEAITAEAELLATWNLRDFPTTAIQRYGLEVLSPDQLVTRLLVNTPEETKAAIEALRLLLRRPPIPSHS
ncbi:PIN domain-containing protein [Deinococcus humi]|uniref:PIN domain-containing protein n=1 Tax=Deinococcus humi TaxID=662880 RepID=A0A7W8JUM9_9DEIO|nr:PIN domain-containing protein [Deinococcus humi]MBB5363501.1 hypothetical protein [Deinococcus humi]GGO30495.1 hypothetical protein GCM10008949_25420 [Deinococcus humi]